MEFDCRDFNQSDNTLVEFAGARYDVDRSIQVAKELKKFAD